MNKKEKRRRILQLGILIIVALGLAVLFGPLLACNYRYIGLPPVTTEQLDELPLDGINKLMIVAHPDDEYIWGGAHLLTDDWLVVVITNGDNDTRRAEFESMMEHTGDVGLMLSYPDKVGGSRSNWDYWAGSIRTDLETVIGYRNWEQIVTHNRDGEYGHQHHIYAHKLVVEAYRELNSSLPLTFFGTYYRNVDLPDNLTRVDSDILARKESLASIYESQTNTVKKFRHMFPYENLITYDGTD